MIKEGTAEPTFDDLVDNIWLDITKQLERNCYNKIFRHSDQIIPYGSLNPVSLTEWCRMERLRAEGICAND